MSVKDILRQFKSQANALGVGEETFLSGEIVKVQGGGDPSTIQAMLALAIANGDVVATAFFQGVLNSVKPVADAAAIGGITGVQGIAGTNGGQGVTGIAGSQGVTGVSGITGLGLRLKPSPPTTSGSGTLVKISGDNATWDAFAWSDQTASAGQPITAECVFFDGSVTFFGLIENVNPQQSYFTLPYSWVVRAATCYVYEDGNEVFQVPYAAGDVFTVESTGTQVNYKHNGQIEYTSGKDPSSQALFPIAMGETLGERFDSATVSINNAPAVDIVWSHFINMDLSTPTLGREGDSVLTSNTGALYEMIGGDWFYVGSLRGVTGPQGGTDGNFPGTITMPDGKLFVGSVTQSDGDDTGTSIWFRSPWGGIAFESTEAQGWMTRFIALLNGSDISQWSTADDPNSPHLIVKNDGSLHQGRGTPGGQGSSWGSNIPNLGAGIYGSYNDTLNHEVGLKNQNFEAMFSLYDASTNGNGGGTSEGALFMGTVGGLTQTILYAQNTNVLECDLQNGKPTVRIGNVGGPNQIDAFDYTLQIIAQNDPYIGFKVGNGPSDATGGIGGEGIIEVFAHERPLTITVRDTPNYHVNKYYVDNGVLVSKFGPIGDQINSFAPGFSYMMQFLKYNNMDPFIGFRTSSGSGEEEAWVGLGSVMELGVRDRPLQFSIGDSDHARMNQDGSTRIGRAGNQNTAPPRSGGATLRVYEKELDFDQPVLEVEASSDQNSRTAPIVRVTDSGPNSNSLAQTPFGDMLRVKNSGVILRYNSGAVGPQEANQPIFAWVDPANGEDAIWSFDGNGHFYVRYGDIVLDTGAVKRNVYGADGVTANYVTAANDPTQPDHLTRKDYVDARISRGSDDPSVTAMDGIEGQLYIRTVAPFGVYQKMDSGVTTNWQLIAGGNMETFSIAGYTVNKEHLVVLYGKAQSTTAQGMIYGVGPGAFQVPVGKKLLILGARFGGNSGWMFGYCDNDPGLEPVDPNTLVNLVYQGNGYTQLQAHADGSVPVGFEVPAGKYPIEQSGDGGLTYGNYFCVLLDA